jgi:hypothetical protein
MYAARDAEISELVLSTRTRLLTGMIDAFKIAQRLLALICVAWKGAVCCVSYNLNQ